MRPSEKRRNPYLDKIFRYALHSRSELSNFVLISILYSIIISFNDWGVYSFSFFTGLGNLAISFVVVLISFGLYQLVQRWYSAHRGYQPEHKVWAPGIIISIILLIVTNGGVPMLASTGVFIHHLAVQRLGTFRYGENLKILGPIALLGLLSATFIAGISRVLLDNYSWTPIASYILEQFFYYNIVFLLWNILPIPPLDGSRIFFWSRLQYVFWFSGIGAYLLVLNFAGISSIIIAMITAFTLLALYYYFYEQYWWNPQNVDLKSSLMNESRKKKLGVR